VQLPVQSAGASFHAIIKKGNYQAAESAVFNRNFEGTHVPRDDLTDNTNRLVNSVTQLARINIDDFSAILVGPTAVVSERSGRFQDIESPSDGVCFPVVECLEGREFVGVLFDEFGDLDEDLAPVLTRDVLYPAPSAFCTTPTKGKGGNVPPQTV
jgi:hypothetical protein